VRKSDSSSSTSSGSGSRERKNKKDKKKEEKKRKEEFKGFKDDMLEALDERFDKLKRERAVSRASGSVRSTPRQTYAAPFGMMGGAAAQGLAAGGGVDPLIAQKMRMGMGMGMPPMMGAGAASGNPYAGIDAMPPAGMMGKIPSGPPGMGSGGMRPPGAMQMPVGFADDMSMADMDMGNPYLAGNERGQGMSSRFMSPPQGGAGGMNLDAMAIYGRGTVGMGGIGGRGRGRPPQPCGYAESENSDFGPSRRFEKGKRNGGGRAREDDFDNMTGENKLSFSCHLLLISK
jgi:hypothetical protein